MTIIKPALLLAATLTLAGCMGTVPLQRAQTANLSSGASAADVESAVGKASVLLAHDFESGGKRYLARHYALQTGARQEMMVVCTPNCMAIPTAVPVNTPYVVVYEAASQKLIAWGTIEELSRSPDDSISALMPALKAAQDRAKAKNS